MFHIPTKHQSLANGKILTAARIVSLIDRQPGTPHHTSCNTPGMPNLAKFPFVTSELRDEKNQ